MNPYIIYHGGCRDGFAAAYVAWLFHGDRAYYHPGYYGKLDYSDNAVKNNDVVFIDFIYKYEDMLQICRMANSVTVIDHHKTSEEIINQLRTAALIEGFRFNTLFDLKESGATLAWEYYFPNQPARPDFLNYVKDRDLWEFKHEWSREINAYISTWEFDFNVYAQKHQLFDRIIAKEKGEAVLAKTKQYCREVAKNTNVHKFTLPNGETYDVPVVNAPQVDVSELLEFLMNEYRTNFVMAYWRRHDEKIVYSIRTRGELDASSIAKIYNGGGHKNTAGFESNYDIFYSHY